MHEIQTTPEMRAVMVARSLASGDGKHWAPIIDVLNHGVHVVTLLADKRAFEIPKRHLRRPILAIIGDDLLIAEGPAGFHLRSLRRIFARAGAVYIMAGAPNPEVYSAAAECAKAGLSTVIIETQTTEELAWLDYAKRHAPKAAKLMVTPNCAAYRDAVAEFCQAKKGTSEPDAAR